MKFWDDVRDPCSFQGNGRLSIPRFVPKIQAVKSAVKLRSRQTKVGGDTPNFRHALSNCTLPNIGRFWLSSVQQARKVADEN